LYALTLKKRFFEMMKADETASCASAAGMRKNGIRDCQRLRGHKFGTV